MPYFLAKKGVFHPVFLIKKAPAAGGTQSIRNARFVKSCRRLDVTRHKAAGLRARPLLEGKAGQQKLRGHHAAAPPDLCLNGPKIKTHITCDIN